MARTQHARPAQSSGSTSGLLSPLPARSGLTESLARRLTQEILDGTLAPGSQLPTEQQLVTALGVSRTVVREAVAALRGDGLVVARQGAGVFVVEAGEHRAFRIDAEAMDSLTNVLAVMELRTGIEGEAAGLAATRRTAAELRQLDAAMAALEQAIFDGDDGDGADHAFHRAIMEATHNLYYREFSIYLGRLIRPKQSLRAMTVPPASRAPYLRRVQDEHARIRDAIAAKDEAGAREAALTHLRNSRARYGRLRDRLARQVARSD